jgi:hypothetical protein
MRPEIRAAADKELPPDYPPADIGLLPGNKDEYITSADERPARLLHP